MSFKKLRNIFNNTVAVQIIFVVGVASAIFLFESILNKESPAFKNVPKNEAALFIDLGNVERVFTGEVVDGMTLLDALNTSVAAGQIKLTYYVDSSNNTKINEINDHTLSGNTQFTFYLNSRKLDPSNLNKTQIKPGDKIMVKLE